MPLRRIHLKNRESVIKKFFSAHSKNIAVILGLLALIAWFSSHQRQQSAEKKAEASDKAPLAAAWFQPAPSRSPLPKHFPEAASSGASSLASLEMPQGTPHSAVNRSFETAVETCWPGRIQKTGEDQMRETPLTLAQIEALFGKIRRREQVSSESLTKLDVQARHGLLFDASVFSSGAAGTVTESGGEIKGLRLRAEGRNLVCRTSIDPESHLDCECF